MSTKLTATGIRRKAEDRQHDESSALHSCSCTAWECFEEIVLFMHPIPARDGLMHGRMVSFLAHCVGTICVRVLSICVNMCTCTLWVCASDGT